MGVHVIAGYRPKPGREDALRAETEQHVPLLRRLGPTTDRRSLDLRNATTPFPELDHIGSY